MIKVGDWVKTDKASPVYVVTYIYYNEDGDLCAEGEGRVGAKFKDYKLGNLIKVRGNKEGI